MNEEKVKIKYIAQYITGSQYTEQNWEPIRPTLEVTDTTTIGEIMQWSKGSHFEVWKVEQLNS